MWRGILWLLLAVGGANMALADDKASAPAAESEAPVEPKWITLASGERNGMYYWFANVLGGVVSQPPHALPCDKECGVADSVLVNISSEGSLDNLERLRLGRVQTGFAQSGLAYAAYSGQAPFEGQGNKRLRAIASFYPEVLHIVVQKDSALVKIEDLAGKRLAMGPTQSGTLIGAQNLLALYGLNQGDYDARTLNLGQAMSAFLAGEVDALFFFSAAGNPLVQQIASQKAIRLLPVREDVLKQLVKDNAYYHEFTIPAATYQGQDNAVEGVAAQALWLTGEEADEKLIYALTKVVWEGKARVAWLRDVLPQGAWEVDDALKGIGIPLHPGAKRYYNEIGKRF